MPGRPLPPLANECASPPRPPAGRWLTIVPTRPGARRPGCAACLVRMGAWAARARERVRGPGPHAGGTPGICSRAWRLPRATRSRYQVTARLAVARLRKSVPGLTRLHFSPVAHTIDGRGRVQGPELPHCPVIPMAVSPHKQGGYGWRFVGFPIGSGFGGLAGGLQSFVSWEMCRSAKDGERG